MKYIHLIILVSCIIFTSDVVNGQEFPIDQGAMMIGGGAGFKSSGAEDSERMMTVSVAPSFGYFVYKGLMLGIGLGLENQLQGGDSITSLGVGPSVSYFFGNEDSLVYPFIKAEGVYSNVSYDDIVVAVLYGEVSVGSVYMISNSVGAFASLYAQFNKLTFSQKMREDLHSTGNEFGLRLGITAFIF